MVEYFILTGIVLVLVASFIVVRTKVGGRPGLITKTNASLGLVIAAVYGIMSRGFDDAFGFIVLGLVFGLVGDIMLDLKVVDEPYEKYYTNAGMAAFALGHVMYFCAVLSLSSGASLWLPLVVSLGVSVILSSLIMFVISKPMKLEFGKYFTQSYIYLGMLLFMTSLTIYLSFIVANMWIFALGMGLFLISDLILSTQYFGGKLKDKMLITLNHIFYYFAQIAVFSVIYFI